LDQLKGWEWLFETLARALSKGCRKKLAELAQLYREVREK
jgi:hypothetical protein